MADIVVQVASSSPTAPGLDCLTPTQAPSSARTRELLEVSEPIFINIRGYFLSSFGDGTWISDSKVSDCISTKHRGNEMTVLKNLFIHHDVACRLLDEGSFEEVERVLVNASAGIKDTFSAEHPRTVGALFDLVMYLRGRKRSKIVIILLRQFETLATMVLPANHPLGQVYKHFTSLDATHFEAGIITAWQSALNHFESILGPMHYFTSRSRLDYTQMVESMYSLERAEMMLKTLVHHCKSSSGVADVRTLKLLDTLAETLMDQQKYVEAEEAVRDIITHASHAKPRSKSIDLCVAGLFILARVQYNKHRIDMVEANLRRAINLNMSE
jgi:hypothetical protein